MKSLFSVNTYSIHADRFDISADAKLAQIVGHMNSPRLEAARLKLMRQSKTPYYIKTHFVPDERVSVDDSVIYLIRDGRDAICSYKNYIENFAGKFVSLEQIIIGQVKFGMWAGHVEAWHNAALERKLILKYEDFKVDERAFISKIAEFLNLRPSSDAVPSFDVLQKINQKFFEKGQTARWNDTFSDDHHLLFCLLQGDIMQEFGYTNGLLKFGAKTETGEWCETDFSSVLRDSIQIWGSADVPVSAKHPENTKTGVFHLRKKIKRLRKILKRIG